MFYCVTSIILTFLVVYLFFKNREKHSCNFCFQNRRSVFQENQLPHGPDLCGEVLAGPLQIMARIIDAEAAFYAFLKSDGEIELSAKTKDIKDKSAIIDVCKKIYNKPSDVSALNVNIDNNLKGVVGCKVIVDSYVVGVICFVFKSAQPFNIDCLELVHTFSDLVKIVEKGEIIEEALGRCECDLETMMQSSMEGVVIIDRKMRVRRVNNIAQEIFGLSNEEILYKDIRNIISLKNDAKNNITENIFERVIGNAEQIDTQEQFILESVSGKNTHVKIKISPIVGDEKVDGAMFLVRDIEIEKIVEIERVKHKEEKQKHFLELQAEVEQRKEIEKALIRSAALASAGTLAAGIAHEYNNINSIAMCNLDIVLNMPGISDTALESLKTVRKMISRGAEVTKGLLDYARENANGINKKMVSLLELVENTKSLVHKEFSSEGIEFISNFDSADKTNEKQYTIFADPAQVKQAILNIVLNARHAVNNRPEKTVSFHIESNDKNICLKISDTGHGISEEDQKKLFDPFFSTKGSFAREESQKKFTGNGLGLAMCSLIMKKNGGEISVESEINVGTTFTLTFENPSDENKNPIQKDTEEEKSNTVVIKNGKNKRVLVLDDEFELCKLLTQTLKTYNYEVFSGDDGYEALEEHEKNPFELVVTDIQMPKMTGIEFLNKLSKCKGIKPKVMILTGRIQQENLEETEYDEFLYKPFDLSDFVSKVQELLDL